MACVPELGFISDTNVMQLLHVILWNEFWTLFRAFGTNIDKNWKKSPVFQHRFSGSIVAVLIGCIYTVHTENRQQ